MTPSPHYLSPDQARRIRRWEAWNMGYFVVAFITLLTLLVFSSQLGLSDGNDWSGLGIIIALLVIPIIVLQLRLACPACAERIGWQAKMMAPDQCRHCHTFLRAR